MKKLSLLFFLLFGVCFSQTTQTSVIEDFEPSSTNQQGRDYPMVNSEGRVRVRISAPEAKRVQLDISAVKYDLVKDTGGVWMGELAPQDEGFHYYQLWIDGASAPDPSSLFFLRRKSMGQWNEKNREIR